MTVDNEQIKSYFANMEAYEAEVAVKAIIKWSEDVQGSWNGDEPGRGEEQAGSAEEIEGSARELLEMIQNHNNL